MAETPRRNRAQRHLAPETPTHVKRLNGTYQDGRWWCNCEPRRHAALREVRKETPNKGKLFYACPRFDGCHFFLFWDDAKIRQTGLSSSQSEPEDEQRPKTPTLTQHPLTSFGVQVTPGKRRQSKGGATDDEGAGETAQALDPDSNSSTVTLGYPSESDMSRTMRSLRTPDSAKRQKTSFTTTEGSDSDEFSDLAVDSDEEKQLVALTDASARKIARGAPESLPTTPATGSRTVGGLRTPGTARTLFPSDRPRRKSVSFEDISPSRAGEDATTSTETLGSQPDQKPPADLADVTKDIMDLLQSKSIDEDLQRSVRKLLAVAAKRAKGLDMGRERAREAAKRQAERVVSLQDRIAQMENKAKVREDQITSMKAKLRNLWQEN